MPGSPLPNLQVRPNSGLSFAWTELHPDGKTSSSDASLGPDGVTVAMAMLVYWDDLAIAIKELLGYSWREVDTSITPNLSTLRRMLPWRHPLINQCWVRNISSIKGLQLRGLDDNVDLGLAGTGDGSTPITGPGSVFTYAQLTLHFWRPPYYIRSDQDILDDGGEPREWLRYVDKNWEISTYMLSREAGQFIWADDQADEAGGPHNNGPPGSVGQKLTHLKVKRRWYEIPETAIFETLEDGTPQGLPLNLLYMQTKTTNPITQYVQDPTATPHESGYNRNFNYPIVGCVNSPIGGDDDDTNPDDRFFGCFMGTLLLEGIELVPRPLQLPAALMQIPAFANNEAVSQVQYDVVFHFDLFDPPRAPHVIEAHPEYRGHNLMPWAGDGLWYAVHSQNAVTGSFPAEKTTPVQYADFTDLFKIL